MGKGHAQRGPRGGRHPGHTEQEAWIPGKTIADELKRTCPVLFNVRRETSKCSKLDGRSITRPMSHWSGLAFQFPELPAVQSSASLLTSLSLSFLLCKMGIIRPTPRTAKAGFLQFQPQVKMGFRGVSQSLKLYLGTVCGVCVCVCVMVL